MLHCYKACFETKNGYYKTGFVLATYKLMLENMSKFMLLINIYKKDNDVDKNAFIEFFVMCEHFGWESRSILMEPWSAVSGYCNKWVLKLLCSHKYFPVI